MNDTQKKIMDEFFSASTLENSVPDGNYAPKAVEPAIPEEIINLPEPELLPDVNVNLLELIELRSTVRQYSDKPLTQKELSYLLWCTQGVKSIAANGATKRTVPSAGGQHVLTTYLYIQKVEDMAVGLYRFLPAKHALAFVAKANVTDGGNTEFAQRFFDGFKNHDMVQKSAVTFVWVADVEKMTARFGMRGCRYVFLDAGHVCQNLYLAALSRQIGVCAVGAFSDEKLSAALDLDSRVPVYCATAGKI